MAHMTDKQKRAAQLWRTALEAALLAGHETTLLALSSLEVAPVEVLTPLTDAQIGVMWGQMPKQHFIITFARAIEQAHGIGKWKG